MAAQWRLWGRLAATGPATLVAPVHFRTGNPTVLWCDSLNGNDANTGKNKEEPKQTIESALAAAVNGTLIVLKPGFSQTVAALLNSALTGLRICGEGSGALQARLLTGDANGLFTTTGSVDFENVLLPASSVALVDRRLSVTTGGRLRLFGCTIECGVNDVEGAVYNLSSTLRVSGCIIRAVGGHPLQAVGMTAGFTEIDGSLIDGGVFGWRDDGLGRQVAVEIVNGWLDMHGNILRGHSDVFVHVETAATIAEIQFANDGDLGEDCSILFEEGIA